MEKIYSIKESAAALGVSRRTIYHLIDAGSLPRPMQLSPGRVGFLQSTLQAYRDAAASTAKGRAA